MTEVPTQRPHGAPCWVSLLVHNLEATQDFYSNVFGWEFETPAPQPFGTYVRATLRGLPVAGLGKMPKEGQLPTTWTAYFASDDVDLTTELVRDCGGTVGVGPLDADDAGRMALGADVSGAVFGVCQPRVYHGVEVVGEPGTLAWNELVTRETTLVSKFYQAVFGCETEAVVSADFDYLTLLVNGQPVAGIHGVGQALPRDRGARWVTYFAVEDTDAAARGIAELGGRVIQPPHDSAYGRMAAVADPEGATFNIIRTVR